jgi:AraC-like DNA-binding protein
MLRHRSHADAEGRWEMVLAAPDARLSGTVVGDYVGWREDRRAPSLRREVPKSLVPVILNFGAPFDVFAPANEDEGLVPFDSFIAGAHDSFALTRQQANRCLQFNLSFLGAYQLLRLPMECLANRVVALDAVLGREVRALVEELGNDSGWGARFQRLDRWLLRRLAEAPQPASEVRSAMTAIVASGGTLSIGALATAEGVSRKRLIQLFRANVGLAPKRIARLVRFERAMALLLQPAPGGLAEIALDSGYSDQAHFNRDFRAMTGATPSTIFDQLPPELLQAGKNLQDRAPDPA